MPATPPVTYGDEPEEPKQHSFQLRYDALVIAVGAYNQSKLLSLITTSENMLILSDQRSTSRG